MIDYLLFFFLVILILIKPSIISSSDYVDTLDLGMPPIEDSQYFIVSFIQRFIDENINNIHPELKSFLQTSVFMDLK